MNDCIFSLENICKSFAGKAAVRDLDFSLKKGSITGFLGPNGAGKSTSLRIGLGIIRPDKGKALLFGNPPTYKALDRVGFLPEERGLYRKMKTLAAIVHFARLKGMHTKAARKQGMALLERFELGGIANKKIKTLSKGMAQKVQIITAIVHAPELVILDEPFSGLDPVNQKILEDLVRELAQNGATVLFSTHVMEHAERLCDRIMLLSQGRKIFDGTVTQALDAIPRSVWLQTSNKEGPAAVIGDLALGVSPQTFGPNNAQGWRVDLAPGTDIQDILRVCIAGGINLQAFEPRRRHLHDVFMHLVGQSNTAEST